MRIWFVPGLFLIVLVMSACASNVDAQAINTPTPAAETTPSRQATPLPGNLDQVAFIEDDQRYVIQQLVYRDGIRPIYDPQFASAEDSPYHDDELVMGLEINGDARAYSVGILRRREMLNDVVGGSPVLVTW